MQERPIPRADAKAGLQLVVDLVEFGSLCSSVVVAFYLHVSRGQEPRMSVDRRKQSTCPCSLDGHGELSLVFVVATGDFSW